MATIIDLAAKAGVAPITVSRVINNSGYVREDVRKRVQQAIEELDYVPNALARGLRSKRTYTLSLVLTDITNPFFTTMARGVEDAASANGYMLLVCNTDEREDKERVYLQLLLQKRADGILLVPSRKLSVNADLFRNRHTPVVILDRRVEGISADVVRGDSVQGAYQLGVLLASLGHKRIAMITGPSGVSSSEDRETGFRKAMREAGIESTLLVYNGYFVQESGMEMTNKALQASPPPTAIFAANNFIAIGALKTLQAKGLRVPEDIAMVAFDDLPESMVTFPFLTVAAQPAYDIGVQGVRLLLERLESEAPTLFREVVLPNELIVRKSSGEAVKYHQ